MDWFADCVCVSSSSTCAVVAVVCGDNRIEGTRGCFVDTEVSFWSYWISVKKTYQVLYTRTVFRDSYLSGVVLRRGQNIKVSGFCKWMKTLFHAEFAVYPAGVPLNGIQREVQTLADFLVGKSFGNELQHFDPIPHSPGNFERRAYTCQ